jgi:hypothetical protein
MIFELGARSLLSRSICLNKPNLNWNGSYKHCPVADIRVFHDQWKQFLGPFFGSFLRSIFDGLNGSNMYDIKMGLQKTAQKMPKKCLKARLELLLSIFGCFLMW